MLLNAVQTNPGQFFGACGFFELASHLRPETKAVWNDKGLEFLANNDLFSETINMINRLELRPIQSWPGKESVCPFYLCDDQTGFRVLMDWWEKRHDGANSIYKCFGGQLKAAKLSNNMLSLCRSAATATPEKLFSVYMPASSRLGYDPRSSWNTQDAGFSPNEHRNDSSVATYPFTEFLSSIALQTFPFQVQLYNSWQVPLMIATSRIAASGGGYGDKFMFTRLKRGQLFAFNFSTLISD